MTRQRRLTSTGLFASHLAKYMVLRTPRMVLPWRYIGIGVGVLAWTIMHCYSLVYRYVRDPLSYDVRRGYLMQITRYFSRSI